jgi:calcineurin-like phosphoesterase family protein
MDDAVVRRWNETVGHDDTVWHLGDFAVRVALGRAADLLGALSGIKHLIAGNNDPPGVRTLPGWVSVRDYAELELDGRRLILCHYPLRAWKAQHRGALQLHGHSHGRLKPLPRQFDVGVDGHDFRPVTLEDLLGESAPRRGAPART